MEYRVPAPAGFDERAALDELERIRAEIERSKARRKELDEEFDAFIRSFKNPSAPRISPPKPPPRAAVAAPEHPDPPAPLASPAVSRRRSWRKPALLTGTMTVLAVGGWVAWTVRTRAPQGGVPSSSAQSPGRTAESLALPPASQPAAPVSELTTTRAVWVRVLADGARVIERELPANARIPLTARDSIVIRAGNAAAVRVTLAGQDQGALGPEGIAVTRTFRVPSDRGRRPE